MDGIGRRRRRHCRNRYARGLEIRFRLWRSRAKSVVTTLNPDYPLIRFATGDLVGDYTGTKLLWTEQICG